jgi:hypothetical protein
MLGILIINLLVVLFRVGHLYLAIVGCSVEHDAVECIFIGEYEI